MFPFSLAPVLLVLVFLLTYGWADRFSGGGFGWDTKLSHDHGGPLRGKPSWYALIVVSLIGLLFAGSWGLIFGLSWGIARGIGWKLKGHSAVTPSAKEVGYAFARHCFPLIGIALCWVAFRINGYLPTTAWFLLLLIYPTFATGAARIQAEERLVSEKDVNPRIEMLRGACFGLVSAVVLYIGM